MMKKIRDILPPESLTPFHKSGESLIKDKNVSFFKNKKASFFKKDLHLKNKIKAIWFLIPLFLIVVFIFAFKISKAEIGIWPKTETVSFRTELTINTETKKSDFGNRIISGEIFNIEKNISESFPSSGKALKKTEGIIRLHNAFTTKSETWLAGTRFVSDDGKFFKSKDKISVPGAGIKDGKIIPSYVDVPVVAAEAGEEYNINPSYFSIYVYRGTPRYTKFYGESFESMEGGGESSQIIEKDLQTAEKILIKKVSIKSEKALENEIRDEFIFLEDILKTEITERFSSSKIGDASERFNFRVKAKSTTIIFKKEEVESFVKNFILSQLPEQKLLYEKTLNIDYTPKIVDFESGKVILSLSFSAEIYPEIDLPALKQGLIGRSLAETKISLESQPEIINTKIRFWPFWVKSVPKDLNKIKIKYPVIDTLNEFQH